MNYDWEFPHTWELINGQGSIRIDDSTYGDASQRYFEVSYTT